MSISASGSESQVQETYVSVGFDRWLLLYYIVKEGKKEILFTKWRKKLLVARARETRSNRDSAFSFGDKARYTGLNDSLIDHFH